MTMKVLKVYDYQSFSHNKMVEIWDEELTNEIINYITLSDKDRDKETPSMWKLLNFGNWVGVNLGDNNTFIVGLKEV